MNKHFLNEEGITLTELLAALSLFAVVSALVMTVLFNVFQNSENISDNAQLRQDANLLVSTLRSHYNQGDFEVGLNTSNSLLIGGQEVNSSMTSSIDELELKNGENSISAVNPAVNQSMTVKADGTPLSINLTLKNEAGQTYNLFTTIEKPAEQAIALQVFEVPDPFVPDPRPVLDGYEPGGYCESFDRDTKYAYDPSNQFIPDNCNEEITIEGNAWVSRDHHHNVVEMKHGLNMDPDHGDDGAKFNVRGNLFVEPNEFNIDNRHPMDVRDDALFTGKLELKNRGQFIATNIHAVGGNHNNKGVVVRDHTRLEARQSMVVAKIFEMKDHGHAIIGKNLIIDGNLEMYNFTEIIVEGNARINNLILGGNSKLTIKGNLVITGDVKPDVYGNSGTLRVGGSSKGIPDWLTVEGLTVED